MPDWSYHPLLRPVSAWLPVKTRRTLALRGLQAIAAAPGGSRLIDFLGRMTPDDSLRTTVYGKTLISPIGLGGGVDPDAMAIGALGRFGVGFVEVGPYALGAAAIVRVVPEPLTSGVEARSLGARLRRRPMNVSIWLRLVVAEDDPKGVSAIEHLLGSTDGVDVVSIGLLGADGGHGTGRIDL